MEKVEIKCIAEYLTNLEGGVYECDYREITMLDHLTKLYQIIK